MCPPGVDQTCRTTQRWTLMAPLLRESQDLTQNFFDENTYRSSPEVFLSGDHTFDAFDKLARRAPRKGVVWPEPQKLGGHRSISALERLPTELLNMVIADPSLSVEDIMSLGLCSLPLWMAVLDHVKRTCSTAPWAHTPLLCTGTYLTTVPPVVRALVPDMDQQEREYAERSQRTHRPGVCPARQWNWEAIDTFKDVSNTSDREQYLEAFQDASKTSGISGTFLKSLQKSLRDTLLVEEAKKDTIWILRNHTAHEYVVLKKEHRVGDRDNVHVKGMPWLSLDKALILRICWSCGSEGEDGDWKRSLLKRTCYGKWAGHHFDVVCGKQEELCNGWHDGTAEILQEAKLWKKAFHASREHLNGL